jgi:hypothetical protein
MTTSIYNIARRSFALALVNWQANPFQAAIPKLGYVFSVGGHSNITSCQPLRSTTLISSRTVDTAGWFLCDPVQFDDTPINENIDQIIFYRQTDGLLLLNISFPAIKSSVSKPLILLKGASRPGICRL